jgi:hypothetical protein
MIYPIFNFQKILLIFISIYIFLINFYHWDYNRIRASEFFFILIIFYSICGIYFKKISFNIINSDLIIFLLLLSSLLIYTMNGFDRSFLFGVFFYFYIFIIYIFFRNILEIFNYKIILKIILVSSLVVSTTGIIGWILYQFNIENILAQERDYPFKIGKSIRANSLFSTPNMFAINSISSIIILSFFNSKNLKYYYFYLFVFLTGLLITFSKSIILLFGLLFLYLYLKSNKKNFLKVYLFLFIFFLIIQTLFTNFIIINDNKTNSWLNHSFVKDNSLPIFEVEGYKIYKTIYFDLKNKSLLIIKEYFPDGVGFRNFSKININEFDYLKDINAHSIYFGSLSEIGIFAISIIFFLFFMINNSIKLYLKNKEFLFLILFFTYFIAEGINTDLMSYKITWIIVAISLYLNKITKDKNDY